MNATVRPRAMVFIDGANLHNGLKECYGIERLDLERYCQHLSGYRELRRIYYAEAPYIQSFGVNGPENYRKQQSYHAHIKKISNLTFRKGYYISHTVPPTEKLCDVYVATDMVDLCYRDEYDVAYLIAGDSDLAPAADIVTGQGKRVFNVYFDYKAKPDRNSYGLRGHCSAFINITRTIAEQYRWNPPPPPQQTP